MTGQNFDEKQNNIKISATEGEEEILIIDDVQEKNIKILRNIYVTKKDRIRA